MQNFPGNYFVSKKIKFLEYIKLQFINVTFKNHKTQNHKSINNIDQMFLGKTNQSPGF